LFIGGGFKLNNGFYTTTSFWGIIVSPNIDATRNLVNLIGN
jgi:hypothetical protein